MDDDTWMDDEFPAYLRPRFLVVVLVLAGLAGYLLYLWGTPEPVALTSGDADVTRSTIARDDVPAAETPVAAGADCPSAAAVNLEASMAIAEFMEGAATPEAPTVPATEEIQSIIDEAAPAPAVLRMARLGGFKTSGASVSTCVVSTESDTSGVTRSIDRVLVEAIDDEWVVTGWTRGGRQPEGDVEAVALAFFDDEGSCRNPDRMVSVRVPTGTASQRLRRAVEEVFSGPTGLAPGATTQLPPDVQVVEATVEGAFARIVLTPTSDDLTRCEGIGAAEQVVETAEALVLADLASAAPDADPDDLVDDITVELVIGGEAVESLRS